MSESQLLQFWVIYDRPTDHPNHIVVRVWDLMCDNTLVPRQEATFYETIEAAQKNLPPGLYNIGRFEKDDPAIAEVWI